MATIKSYTNLEQSRKLTDILPLESANMWWAWYSSPLSNGHYGDFPMFCKPVCNPDESIPCWSLAALFDFLPSNQGRYTKSLYWFDDAWHCEYVDEDGAVTLGTSAENAIDACYEMILKLHEQKLL
jgi:hypothetical protein